ncbi:MAG: DUF5715 family protein [Longimicrobiales bacterium]
MLADSIEDLLRPVPLMRPGEETSLRRFSNAAHLARARAIGVRASNEAEVEALVRDGRLVALEDGEYWRVRELGRSSALVVPETERLLRELGERFQAELVSRGLPRYRFEISSALRTAEDQAALRQTNVNAAAGTSSHEFGTTVDIPYAGYAAPAESPFDFSDLAPADWTPALERIGDLALERIAARKSRELRKILGDVLRELQGEGEVLVTLETLQPVYHITVAR